MRTAYFDCFSGVSGDMCLGALIDSGLSLSKLEEYWNTIPLSGYTVTYKETKKKGISAGKVDIKVHEEQPARKFQEIEDIVNNSTLPEPVKTTSVKVFQRLTEAEAKIHGFTDYRKGHLHEVGAVDAILDITGTVLGLYLLDIDTVASSPLPLGGGHVVSSHGLIPVPAPATVELIKGIPITSKPAVKAELVTPTGAALISTLSEQFGHIPEITVESIGYGAGSKDFDHPNVLRIIIGSESNLYINCESDTITVLETNIDDMNPEIYSYLGDRLLSAGALDYFITPVYMKRGRPGAKLSVLLNEEDLPLVSKIIFMETSSLGCRIRREERMKLPRKFITVETPYGPVDVKYNIENNIVSPEFQQCEKLAASSNKPVKLIYDAAKLLGLKKLGILT